MSACERCWGDAYSYGGSCQAETYRDLLAERVGDKACTPEQQAGKDAEPCSECGGRRVRHQVTGQCMVDASHGGTP